MLRMFGAATLAAGALLAATPAAAAVMVTPVASGDEGGRLYDMLVVQTGTYRMVLGGASGGSGHGGAGGQGAVLTAEFDLVAGQLVTVLLGQAGGFGDGGGGSFFTLGFDPSASGFQLLLAAGGGGGGGGFHGGVSASLGTAGTRGTGGGFSDMGAGGTNGGGGADFLNTGGGGGFFGRGGGNTPSGVEAIRNAFATDDRTGILRTAFSTGGLGHANGGGGGGGYSGGGGGGRRGGGGGTQVFRTAAGDNGGGGGGSFTAASGRLVSGEVDNTGSGYFSLGLVTRLAPPVADPVAAVPEPATWAMMIAGFALVGATRRRRRPLAA